MCCAPSQPDAEDGLKQAALERHLSPRGLLPFGRREGTMRASLRADVEHWQRELANEQVGGASLGL